MDGSNPTAHSILSEVFGFDGFRPMQADIVSAVAAGTRRACHSAHGWREISVFSTACLDAPGIDRGDLAVDCPDARSGARA